MIGSKARLFPASHLDADDFDHRLDEYVINARHGHTTEKRRFWAMMLQDMLGIA